MMRLVEDHPSFRRLLRAACLTLLLLSGCIGGGDGPAWFSPTPVRLPQLPEGLALVGLEGGTVRDLLGRPNVARDEKQAHLWRYDLGRCQLDLFFYPDPRTGRQQVAYANVRPSGSARRSTGCSEVARRLRVAAAGEPDASLLGSSEG